MKHKKEHGAGLKHMIMMALACIIPLAIIFILSFLDISNKWINGGVIVLMVILHVMMMKYHFFTIIKKEVNKK